MLLKIFDTVFAIIKNLGSKYNCTYNNFSQIVDNFFDMSVNSNGLV